MNNKNIFEAIRANQNNQMLHPLTCGNDSRHTPLVPVEKKGKVILRCVDCDYEQTFIPGVFNSEISEGGSNA